MENQQNKEIHIGKLLRKHIDEKKYNQAALARREGWKARDVAYYFKKPSLQVTTLMKLSQGLKYNFLREIADQLPSEFPPHAPNPLEQRVAELEEENKLLKKEIEVLKEVVGVRKER